MGAYLGAPNMVKWGVPEKILQNAVQTRWSWVNRTLQSSYDQISFSFPHCNYNVKLKCWQLFVYWFINMKLFVVYLYIIWQLWFKKNCKNRGGKKCFCNTLLLNLKKKQSIFPEFDNVEKTEERGCLEIVILEVKVRHCEPSSLIDGKWVGRKPGYKTRVIIPELYNLQRGCHSKLRRMCKALVHFQTSRLLVA